MTPVLAASEGARIVPLMPATRPGWSRFNPSILAHPDGGLWCTVRSSNYLLDAVSGDYEVTTWPPVVASETYLARLKDDGTVYGRWSRIDDSAVRIDPPLYPVTRLEDGRLVVVDGFLALVGNLREHRDDGLCHIAIDLLDVTSDAAGAPESISVVRRIIVESPDPGRHEKNWMPVLRQEPGADELVLRRFCLPAEDRTVDLMSGRTKLCRRDDGDRRDDLRGGSQVVAVGGREVAIVHEPVEEHGQRKGYLHRWVTTASSGVHVSEPFSILGPGIEFVAGLVVDEYQTWVSLGVGDAAAFLIGVPTTATFASPDGSPVQEARHVR